MSYKGCQHLPQIVIDIHARVYLDFMLCLRPSWPGGKKNASHACTHTHKLQQKEKYNMRQVLLFCLLYIFAVKEATKHSNPECRIKGDTVESRRDLIIGKCVSK
jgi:hypothetical protein